MPPAKRRQILRTLRRSIMHKLWNAKEKSHLKNTLRLRECKMLESLDKKDQKALHSFFSVERSRVKMARGTIRFWLQNRKISNKQIHRLLLRLSPTKRGLVNWYLGGDAKRIGKGRMRAIHSEVPKEVAAEELGIPLEDFDIRMLRAVADFCKKLRVPIPRDVSLGLLGKRTPPKRRKA